MSHRDASLAALVLVSLVCPLSAQALSFSIDPLLSPLTVSNASLETSTTPPFLTDVLPAPGTDFARSVGGTLDADPITGVVMSGDLVLLGAPLVGDQMRFSTRLGDYRDIGDLVVTDLGISFDALGNVSLSSGLATYDISQGSTRIVSIIPNDLSGDMSIFANIAGPPSVVDLGGTLQLTVPVLVDLQDLHLTSTTLVDFTVSGQLVATAVPEPSTGLLCAFGLAWLGARRRWRSQGDSQCRQHRRRRLLASALPLMLLVCSVGCFGVEEEEDQTVSLPPVDAIDDSASTQQGVSVVIAILANDLQDDDFVDAFTQPVDGSASIQGSVMSSVLLFPEGLEYTPPADFVGTVTFSYDIVGLGFNYDFASGDTATVTVTVTQGLPPVDAVDDMAVTQVDQSIILDVLLNDSQDADLIDSFADAMDSMANVQPGSVAIVTNGVEMLEYTPPSGFMGTVDIEYTIVGTGTSFEAGSTDGAFAMVDVQPPPMGPAEIQFVEDTTSLEFIEGANFYLGQDAIDTRGTPTPMPTASLIFLGQASACVSFPAGVNVPVQAEIFEDQLFIIDGICPQILAGADYTIRLIDGVAGLELVCDEGVIDDPVACAGP